MAVLRQLAHAFGVGDVDALIQPVPGPAQHAVGQAHGFVGEIGGDLFHQRDGVLLGFLVRDLLAARFVLDRFFDRFGRQQLVEQILTGRQARAYCSQALTREVHARHARQFLRDGFIRTVLGGHAAQRNGVGETHEAVAAEPQHGEEFLHAVQQTQVRRAVAFAARRAAEHHRNRQHLNVEIRVAAVQIQIVVEQLYRLFFRGVIAEHARAVVNEHVARQHGAVDLQRVERIGQILRQALSAQRQQIRLGIVR